jgi:hypothetical protein
LPIVLLATTAGGTASLLVVWLVSACFGFDFNPSVVAVLSASCCAAAFAAGRRQNQS